MSSDDAQTKRILDKLDQVQENVDFIIAVKDIEIALLKEQVKVRNTALRDIRRAILNFGYSAVRDRALGVIDKARQWIMTVDQMHKENDE